MQDLLAMGVDTSDPSTERPIIEVVTEVIMTTIPPQVPICCSQFGSCMTSLCVILHALCWSALTFSCGVLQAYTDTKALAAEIEAAASKVRVDAGVFDGQRHVAERILDRIFILTSTAAPPCDR